VDCVATSAQALDSLRLAAQHNQPYTLGLLDYRIPDMDGMALAQAIKAEPALAAMRLVLLTSFGQRGHGRAALQAGFAGYLVKPIRHSQLYDCLVTVLGLAAMATSPTLVTRHSIAEAQAQTRTRVLVAEDNIVNQKVAVRMLENLGCRVDVVATGREALDALRHCPYDLVFMDCQMPDMDGYAATAAVREHERQTGAHVPIIAMTAYAMQGDREACLTAGMDDYVSKPVQATALVTMLQRWSQIPPNALIGFQGLT